MYIRLTCRAPHRAKASRRAEKCRLQPVTAATTWMCPARARAPPSLRRAIASRPPCRTTQAVGSAARSAVRTAPGAGADRVAPVLPVAPSWAGAPGIRRQRLQRPQRPTVLRAAAVVRTAARRSVFSSARAKGFSRAAVEPLASLGKNHSRVADDLAQI